MTNPWTVDRQWDPPAPTVTQLQSGTYTDSANWRWYAGDYYYPPIIDTPANLSTLLGVTIPPPPDNYATVMAVDFEAGQRGHEPWTNDPPSGNTTQGQKFYFCNRVFFPSNFNNSNNAIKWWQLTTDPSGGGSTNDLILLITPNGGADDGVGAILQNDVNGIYAYPTQISLGVWALVEVFIAIENPWGSATGIVKIFIDGNLVYSTSAATFLAAYPITGLSSSGTQTILTIGSAPAKTWAVGNDIAISGVTPAAFNTTGHSYGSSIAAVTSTTQYTINLDSSTFGAYVSGGYATRMGGGGILAAGMRPIFGGGGSNNTVDQYVIKGRMFAAASDS